MGDNFTTSTIPQQDYERFCKAWCKEGIGWITQLIGPSNEPGKIDVMCYYGSSYYDTTQMSRLIELAVQDCKELGIETRSEEEIASLQTMANAQDTTFYLSYFAPGHPDFGKSNSDTSPPSMFLIILSISLWGNSFTSI